MLRDLVQVEFIIFDSNAYFVKFESSHLNQALLDLISARFKAIGFISEISSLSSQTEKDQTKDLVVLRLIPENQQLLKQRWPPKSKWSWLSHPAVNLTLFVVTFIIVFVTGAATILNKSYSDAWSWMTGLQFSMSLMGILTAHEFGHYVAARYHKLDVSLPYFLPGIILPPGLGIPTVWPGTFGAFIRIKSPIQNKRQLMDVGAAGPIAGFVVCLAVLLYGFITIPDKTYAYQFYDPDSVYNGDPVLHFGGTLLFSTLGALFAGDRMPAMYDIVHYPFLFAGWFGMLVTALNLMPIGQLDGGHITYALMGKRQKYLGIAAFTGIIVLGFVTGSGNWFFWGLLILVLIRIKHPPIVDETEPLDERRRLIGWISIAIFIFCFSANPLYLQVYTR